MPLKLFHGDIANGILVVTIAIDIYVLSTPYWATIERLVEGGPNIGRGVVFGFWEVCENDKSGDDAICTNFNSFFKKYRNQGTRYIYFILYKLYSLSIFEGSRFKSGFSTGRKLYLTFVLHS